MHTARIWMALAIPGGAPGYDYNNKLGNFIAHTTAQTSQRLRGYSHQAPEVKGGGVWRDFSKVTRFRAFGEGEFAGSCYARTVSVARMSAAISGDGLTSCPGYRFAHPGYKTETLPPSHPLAASGFTHSNSGS
jgi:hypothetical protein